MQGTVQSPVSTHPHGQGAPERAVERESEHLMLLARAAARFPAAARLPSKQAVRFASTDNKLTAAFAEPPFMAAAKQNWSRTSYAQRLQRHE